MTQNQTLTPGPPCRSARRSARPSARPSRSSAGLLVEKAAQAGTDRETYLALQRLGVLGDAAATGYVRDLVDWLDLDVGSAAELADGLAPAGLVTAADEAVRSPTDGAQLRAQVAGLISAVTAPLYEALSPADVETTVRTLRGLSTGARAAMQAGQPCGGGESS